jgi:hypothetical protein
VTTIDHDRVLPTAAELDRWAELEPAVPPAATTISRPGAVLLGTLSLVVGVILLASVPVHIDIWVPEGIAFALVGWLQIGLGVWFLTRPNRLALRVSCIANAALVTAWALTRTVGSPFGPHASVVLKPAFVDVTGVAVAAALLAFGCAFLIRPDLGAHLHRSTLAVLSVIPLLAMVVGTAAIASPSARTNVFATTGRAAATSPPDAKTVAALKAKADKGFSLLENGHQHSHSKVALDAATQRQLDAQLAKLKLVVAKYPTVKDAEAAGYRRMGPYSPGLGTHYASFPAPDGDGYINDQLKNPLLVYTGDSPDSKLAGFMYQAFSAKGEPAGFAGPNDHWHYHENVCIVTRPGGGVDAPFGADTTAPKALCDEVGGTLLDNTGYMVHVWIVPGYASPLGMFSELNPKLTCPDGTYYTIPMEDIGTRDSICKSA